MMIKKTKNGKEDVAQVVFKLPADVEGDAVYVMGEFNEWQPKHAMKQQQDGSWELAVQLESEHDYEFRYLVDGQTWLNDPEADKYVPNPFGEENSIVTT